MPVAQLVEELLQAKPGLKPFDPYVIGMRREVMPMVFEDPCVGAAASIFINDLGFAHDLIQNLEGNFVAAYLHGIIHRREGDFWNANYWFRQAKSLSHELGLEPEELTREVESSEIISTELHEKLFSEWKAIVQFILSK